MPEYHVGCGLAGIYAGRLNKQKTMWVSKSLVTLEAIQAVADHMCLELKNDNKCNVYVFTMKDGREMRLWLEVVDKKKYCGTCKHFTNGGDFGLCCDLPHEDYPCGFLCYKDTEACEKYEPEVTP